MKYIKVVIGLSIAIMCYASCSDVATDDETDTDDSGERIVLTNTQEKAVDIQIGAVERKVLHDYIRVNGYFDVPPANKAMVTTYKSGFVKHTSLLVGNKVVKGQVMTILENPEYVNTQQRYLELLGQLDYLKSEFERQQILNEEKINAKKNLLKAEADYKTALASYKGLKKELTLMGVNFKSLEHGTIVSTIQIKAPISGYITEVNATLGQYIEGAHTLFQIVDLGHIHLELSVYEKDILKVQKGQKVLLSIPSVGAREYRGEVYLVGKSLSTENRVVNVHAHVENKNDSFLPGMYAEARIIITSDTLDVLPVNAIVSAQNQKFVFVRNTDQKGTYYEKVNVSTGLKSEDWVAVTFNDSLELKKPIVVNGAYFLSTAGAE